MLIQLAESFAVPADTKQEPAALSALLLTAVTTVASDKHALSESSAATRAAFEPLCGAIAEILAAEQWSPAATRATASILASVAAYVLVATGDWPSLAARRRHLLQCLLAHSTDCPPVAHALLEDAQCQSLLALFDAELFADHATHRAAARQAASLTIQYNRRAARVPNAAKITSLVLATSVDQITEAAPTAGDSDSASAVVDGSGMESSTESAALASCLAELESHYTALVSSLSLSA